MRLQAASFLVGSESDVRHWGPWPAGPVRPSGPCCFGVAKAPFVGLGLQGIDSRSTRTLQKPATKRWLLLKAMRLSPLQGSAAGGVAP